MLKRTLIMLSLMVVIRRAMTMMMMIINVPTYIDVTDTERFFFT